jgi:hypothetical protein
MIGALAFAAERQPRGFAGERRGVARASRSWSSTPSPRCTTSGTICSCETGDRITPQGVTAAGWPLRRKFGSAGAGAESPLSRLQLARSRLAPGASGWLDPAADPDPGPSAEMRACGDLRDSPGPQAETCLRVRAGTRAGADLVTPVVRREQRHPGQNVVAPWLLCEPSRRAGARHRVGAGGREASGRRRRGIGGAFRRGSCESARRAGGGDLGRCEAVLARGRVCARYQLRGEAGDAREEMLCINVLATAWAPSAR